MAPNAMEISALPHIPHLNAALSDLKETQVWVLMILPSNHGGTGALLCSAQAFNWLIVRASLTDMLLLVSGYGPRLKCRPAGCVWTYHREIAALCNGHRSAVWSRLRVKPKQAYCFSHYQTQWEIWILLQGWINTMQIWPGLLLSNTADQGLNPGPTARLRNVMEESGYRHEIRNPMSVWQPKRLKC